MHTYYQQQPDIAQIDAPWLDGFWREENNVPSKPRCVEGDAKAFKRDCRAAARRSKRRLAAYSKIRWMFIVEWDQWDFCPEIWE